MRVQTSPRDTGNERERPSSGTVQGVTEALDRPQHDSHDDVIAEALAVIDQALGQMFSRELVSANEVADVLLDVRSALTTPAPEPEQV